LHFYYYNYGECLAKGDGVDMNKPLAAHYFKLAADQGDARAQSNYGRRLVAGDGVDMNCNSRPVFPPAHLNRI
jgi:TPR repeat protein